MKLFFREIYRWRELTFTLALIDVRQRYRRSVLGVWWTLITLAITLGSLGFLWSTIFKTDIYTYLPYFSVGYVLWNFISALILEGANAFVAAESLIRQCRVPLQVHIIRIFLKNVVIFLINCTLVAVVFGLMRVDISFSGVFTSIFGLILCILITGPCALILAIACARFRDLSQLVSSAWQLLFFITPVMWQKDILSEHNQWIANLNPLATLIDAIRLPLLSSGVEFNQYMTLLIIAAVLMVISAQLFRRYKRNLPYWI